MNERFLRNLDIELFGASHAECVGIRIDGFPAGEAVDTDALNSFLARRAPGRNPYGTARREADEPIFRSGLTDGKTDGSELCAVIENRNARPQDYAPDVPRPSHADYAAIMKYGRNVDLRGGGIFSGRMTAPLCVAGGIALQMLSRRGIEVGAHIASIGGIKDEPFDPVAVDPAGFVRLRAMALPVLDDTAGARMAALIEEVRSAEDSVGGVIECAVTGLPAGLGEHPFFGMENRISHLLFAVPGVKGVEFGAGFALAEMRGSDANDAIRTDGIRIRTETNRSGGVQGGMTNGMPLLFRAAVKPTPSVGLPQKSVSLTEMKNTELRIAGRHDPCICPRAVPVIEAVAALAVLDAMLDENAIGGKPAWEKI